MCEIRACFNIKNDSPGNECPSYRCDGLFYLYGKLRFTCFSSIMRQYISIGTTIVKHINREHVCINTLRPRQNGCHFADDRFEYILLNEDVCISINISLKPVRKGPINNISALVQIMAWRRPGDKPLSEPMMVRLPTHICVTRPQWVKLGSRKIWPMAPHGYF